MTFICNVPGCHERATGDGFDPGRGCRCQHHASGYVMRYDHAGTVRPVKVTIPNGPISRHRGPIATLECPTCGSNRIAVEQTYTILMEIESVSIIETPGKPEIIADDLRQSWDHGDIIEESPEFHCMECRWSGPRIDFLATDREES